MLLADKAYISVSSSDATKEPYVGFVITVQWPQGTPSQGILDYPGRAGLQMQLLELYCNTAMRAKLEDMAASMLAICDDAAVATRVELFRMQLPDDDASANSDAIILQRRAG